MTIRDTPHPTDLRDTALGRIEATGLALCHVLTWLAGPGADAPLPLRRALLRVTAAAADLCAHHADHLRETTPETAPDVP